MYDDVPLTDSVGTAPLQHGHVTQFSPAMARPGDEALTQDALSWNVCEVGAF